MVVYVLTIRTAVLGAYSTRDEAERQKRRIQGSEISRIQVDRPA